eukprot:TRINITY_DN2992_c1_g1_i2.p1 TRINITY_DN2992_c1_g1~~TRINITY_DN2992_c1_g1_i2.p1  ORF type:complete len:474 (+),score=165.54 TRINITY_DN2992_c1_g1_i2:32-1453(+)
MIDTNAEFFLQSNIKELDLTLNTPFKRIEANYNPNYERFIIRDKNYSQQYSQIYNARFEEIKPWLNLVLKTKYKKYNIPIQRTLDLKEGELCFLIGTIYKDMPLKPTVLQQFEKQKLFTIIPPRSNFVSQDDKLILEDNAGRITLLCDQEVVKKTISGCVVAVRGRAISGEFEVIQIIEPGFAPQNLLPKFNDKIENVNDKYVAIVSGLNIGQIQNLLAAQIFIEYLTGHLGSLMQQNKTSYIIRLIIAGNSIRNNENYNINKIGPNTNWKSNKNKNTEIQQETEKALENFHALDALLCQLASSVHVDIMPGQNDPTNFNLPQQPLSPCLFPLSYHHNTLHTVTNPYEFELDGINFLGTSGENVNNMNKYCIVQDRLDLLKKTLNYRHIAPNAPDTLGCYPFFNIDPFTIKTCPHIYFIGNQPEFETAIFDGDDGQQVRAICIPNFSEKFTFILVNLRTLDCSPIVINNQLII